MPTLHAVFVAINKYPNPRHVLEGCVNDLTQFHDFLQVYSSQMGYNLRPLVLTDEQATRANFIDAFKHFQAAETGDQCLFFYAGHGARSAAPEIFWGLESDKMTESIVCYDSRQPGGYDLMDKEFSYLIWNAMQGKDMPLITVTDCCHSGRMRDLSDEEPARERQIREIGEGLLATEYLGFEHYKKDPNGQVSPPQGRRVHLGASRDTETAKEVFVNGGSRGIFTLCLVQALQAAGPLVSYSELVNRVQLRVRSNKPDQSPQLEATFAADRNLRFLSTAVDTGPRPYLVSYDKVNGWMVNAGAIQGFAAGDAENATLLEVQEDKRQIKITEVWPAAAKVEGMDGCDFTRVYPAVVIRRAIPKFEVMIASDSDQEAVVALRQMFDRGAWDLFRLSDQDTGADFIIRTRDKALILTRLHDQRPLFRPVPGYDEAAIKTFLNRLDTVAQWRQVLDLSNPHTSIGPEEIAIELYRVVEPGNEDNNARTELVDWHDPVTFANVFDKGQWHRPAFQLKLKNTGFRTLWVSVLYMGYDFSITNHFLPKEALVPGGEVWMRDLVEGQSFLTIPLQIDTPYLRQGLYAIEEYIKLLVSTGEFSTDGFEQAGLPPDTDEAPHRMAVQRKLPEQRDWQAKEIFVNIVYDPATK